MPHFQPIGGLFFVTFRLANSLPKEILHAYFKERTQRLSKINPANKPFFYNEQKRLFAKFDNYLDRCMTAENWLNIPEIAGKVASAIRHFDGQRYELICYTVMPNHVHLVMDLELQVDSDLWTENVPTNEENYHQLYQILKSIKNYSARQCNELLDRSGTFWQKESYDHLVRDDRELANIIAYTLNNPVKAGLTTHWQEWKFSYVSPKFEIDF